MQYMKDQSSLVEQVNKSNETLQKRRMTTESWLTTDDLRSCDLIGSWTNVTKRAVVSVVPLTHKPNAINLGFVRGKPFLTVKIPNDDENEILEKKICVCFYMYLFIESKHWLQNQRI
jgi:hypothetical protein